MTPEEEIARLRQEVAKKREDLEWAEALIGVMSLRLAKQRKEIIERRKEIAKLKQEMYDVTVLD